MGVTKLWEILKEAKQEVTLDNIKGETLAVDLATWICESEGVKQMHSYVTRPYLRNLFFRVSSVLKANIKLVFVLDGKAPELKWDTISKRLALSGSSSKVSSGIRSRLNAKLKECCVLLDALGVPWIKAEGEAEALCAALNKIGLVDGVITSDGDCFLYGAQTVYRNFSVEKHVPFERYNIEDINTKLSLNHRDLIALGLLLGCDYCPKGVPGVGAAQALKLISSFPKRDPLDVFKIWRKTGKNISVCEVHQKKVHCSTCGHEGSKKDHRSDGCDSCGMSCSNATTNSKKLDNVSCICGWHKAEEDRKKYLFEEKIRTAAMQDPKFPDLKIIQEFSKTQKYVRTGQSEAIDPSNDHSLKEKFSLKPPMLDVACKYLNQKLEWKDAYSIEKVLPLSTHFLLHKSQKDSNLLPEISLLNIIKTRVKDKVQSLEVKWELTEKVDLEVDSDVNLVTIECEESMKKVYPDIVEYFYERIQQEKEDKKKMKAEARKLERRKLKGSPKKPTKAQTVQANKMTDYFKARKTRNEDRKHPIPATLESKTELQETQQAKTALQELEFSLQSLSLSKKDDEEEIFNSNMKTAPVISDDFKNSKCVKLPKSKSTKKAELPVIVFSSDSDSDEIDFVTEQLNKMSCSNEASCERSTVKSEAAIGDTLKETNSKSSAVALADITNGDNSNPKMALENDITFSNELDFSLGVSLLHTPVISKQQSEKEHLTENSPQTLELKNEDLSEINILPDKENIGMITPEKYGLSKYEVAEDSPVFMTLMQRLKMKK